MEASTFLRTFVEAPVCLRPERLRQLQVRAHMHLQRSVALQEVEASTLLHTFAEAPTQRQPERRQLQRRRLSARTPSSHRMSNMTNHFVKTFAKLKVVVQPQNFANVFNHWSEDHQSFRGALPQVLHPVATFKDVNDSQL